jgi:hypothetical protein
MSLAIHTDTPLLPLTQFIADIAIIEVGKTPGGHGDCFYGWAEPQWSDRRCKPHHIIVPLDREEGLWIAKTLLILGHQVVVTEPDDPDDQTGDHHVVDGMPMRYDNAHSH